MGQLRGFPESCRKEQLSMVKAFPTRAAVVMRNLPKRKQGLHPTQVPQLFCRNGYSQPQILIPENRAVKAETLIS